MSDQGGGSSITLERLFRLLQDIQAEQREQRTEMRDTRSLLLSQGSRDGVWSGAWATWIGAYPSCATIWS